MGKRVLTIVLSFFLLLFYGCTVNTSPISKSPTQENSHASSTAETIFSPTPKPAAILVPTATTSPVPVILYQEDFEDTSSGWERYNEFDGMLDYENGAYRMRINATDNLFWVQAMLAEPVENVAIQVTTTLLESQPDSPYGIICRLDDNNQYYYFFITGDGHYGIGKFLTVSGMQQTILVDDGGKSSDVIQQGLNAKNIILAICNEERLTLTVNGTLLLETEDYQIEKGNLALLAGVRSMPGIDVLFDDYVVMEP